MPKTAYTTYGTLWGQYSTFHARFYVENTTTYIEPKGDIPVNWVGINLLYVME